MNGLKEHSPKAEKKAGVFLSLEFYGLLLLTASLATIALIKVPFSQPYPLHLEVAQKIIRGISLQHDITCTIGYPLFLALCLKLAGLLGVFVGQALLYIGVVLLTYLTLRYLGVDRLISFLASLPACFHPYLLLNIKRIIYTNLSAFLMMAFVLTLIWIRKCGLQPIRAVLFGLLLGLVLLDKQNMHSVLPLVFTALFLRRKITRREITWLGVFFGATLATIAAATIPIKGTFYLVDRSYGAYNFFIGANPYSARQLIRVYDAESSAGPALADRNIPPTYLYDPELQDKYLRFGMEYVLQHPLEYVRLIFLKIFTLFRPDYRRIYEAGIAFPAVVFIVQSILALPIWIWGAIRLRCRHRIGLLEGPMAVPLLFLWIFPFAFSNADPRLRLPIDLVLLLDAAFCWSWLRLKRHAPGSA